MAFLTAFWRDLIIFNYEIPPTLLDPLLPDGCEIDLNEGRAFASLVLFEFEQTRVLGIPWPGHVNFSEVNLRLYVKRREGKTVKRGVIFVKELVPRWMIATIARVFYAEPYEAVPIHRRVTTINGGRRLHYSIARRHQVLATIDDRWQVPDPSSHETFIIEHYWGYNRVSPGKTYEYEVQHPTWRVNQLRDYEVAVDFEALYGPTWGFLSLARPYSAFIAEGSAVSVMGRRVLMGGDNAKPAQRLQA